MSEPRGFDPIQDIPVAEGKLRVSSCNVCGAIIEIIVPNGDAIGDPELHFDYHRKRGEI